jgi:hypothetical protein
MKTQVRFNIVIKGRIRLECSSSIYDSFKSHIVFFSLPSRGFYYLIVAKDFSFISSPTVACRRTIGNKVVFDQTQGYRVVQRVTVNA